MTYPDEHESERDGRVEETSRDSVSPKDIRAKVSKGERGCVREEIR